MSDSPWEGSQTHLEMPIEDFDPLKHRAKSDPRETALAGRVRPEFRPVSDLPVPTPQPGFTFRWVRVSDHNIADPRNVSKRLMEGFEPVPAQDQPQMARVLGRLGVNADGNIEIGGLMLCRIPDEVSAARRQYYANQSRQQVQAVDAMFLRDQDRRMPKLAPERSTTISMGQSARN